MIIDWSYFGPALFLLLLPIGLLHGKRTRHRGLTRDWSGQWSLYFTHPHHLFDLLRGAGGAWLLAHSIELAPGASGLMRFAPLTTQGGVLVLGALAQSLFCREPDSCHAPFTYIAGVVAGWAPPLTAAFAIILAVVSALGTRLAPAAFPVIAVATLALGALFHGKVYLLKLIPVSLAAIVPWMIALLLSRELVTTQRIPKASGRPHAPLR